MDLEALKGLSPEEAQQHMGAASSKGQTKMIFVQFNPSVGKQTDMEERLGFFTGRCRNPPLATDNLLENTDGVLRHRHQCSLGAAACTPPVYADAH